MWNSWLDKGKALAEQAKLAAEKLDQQLNESVGVEASSSALPRSTASAHLEDDNVLNVDHAWGDEDDLSVSDGQEETNDLVTQPLEASKEPVTQQEPHATIQGTCEPEPAFVAAAPPPLDGNDSGWDEDVAFEPVSESPAPVSRIFATVGHAASSTPTPAAHLTLLDSVKAAAQSTLEEAQAAAQILSKEAQAEFGAAVELAIDEEEAAQESVGAWSEENDKQQDGETAAVEDEPSLVPLAKPEVATLSADLEPSETPADDAWAEEEVALDFTEHDDSGPHTADNEEQTANEEESATVIEDARPAPSSAPAQQPVEASATAECMDSAAHDQDVPATTSLQDNLSEMLGTLQEAVSVEEIVDEIAAVEDDQAAPETEEADHVEYELSLSPAAGYISTEAAMDEQPLPAEDNVDETESDTEEQLAESTSVIAAPAPAVVAPHAQELLEENAKLKEQLASQEDITRMIEQRLEMLQGQLRQREDQLFSKTEQLTEIQAMHEAEKAELHQKIVNTKEEAKKRIQRAKERVDAMEAKFAAQHGSADNSAKQAEIIAALRSEGENLARKQAEMEKAVRSAKGEVRQLKEKLEDEIEAKERALEKSASLELDLKDTKANLAAARRGESLSEKLEADLRSAREDGEQKATTILSMEQQLKELKTQIRELMEELEASRTGAAIETQREQQRIRKEHNDMIADMESKLQSVERDAALREDALRHEVDELRKRWQDAVRRADSLSMDIQSSTAPLLRQLESAERQSRARSAAAAEIETKLRAELEETVISNEKLAKERTEWKTKYNRLERKAKEDIDELKSTKLALEDRTAKVQQLEEKLLTMETEGAKMKEEWAEVERLANEGVARVRSEMTQTVVESEERYRSQLDALKTELQQEQDKRRQLEEQLDKLLDNAGMIVPPTMQHSVSREAKPKKLIESQGQEEILAGALGGFGADSDDESDEEVEEAVSGSNTNGRSGSFAALEGLTSRLKAAKVELEALRKSLTESERSREQLVEELGEARSAKEKLPLFEARVQELTAEKEEQALEIQALQEDIAEVRELYRSQINMLLDGKAFPAIEKPPNGESANPAEPELEEAAKPEGEASEVSPKQGGGNDNGWDDF